MFCCLTMFTPGVMIIKMSKMAHFLYFLLMTATNPSQLGQNIHVSERSYLKLFQKILRIMGF